MNTRSPDSPGSEPILQEALKAVMKQELRGATWESRSIVQRLLPHDANVVAEVHKSLGDAVRRGQNGWPNSIGERDHYPSFLKLLDDTFRTARDVLGSNAGSHYNTLRFSTYDRETADGIDGAHALKPDLVGCDEDIPSSRKVFWREIRIPVEVKDSWSDMVAQAATYARCMFAASSGRQYALIITLHHPSSEVRFLFFHRGGLTSSPIFDLKTKDGFAMFVAAMAGLAAVNDQVSGGMDDSVNNSQIYLPVGGLWRVENWLFNGNCVRGRATQVVRISKTQSTGAVMVPEHTGPTTRAMARRAAHIVARPETRPPVVLPAPVIPSAGRQSAKASGSKQKGTQRRKANSKPIGIIGTDVKATASSETIERLQRYPEINTLTCHDVLDTPIGDVPSNLAVKDSWPLVDRNNEKAMYTAAQGLFGVPVVLASYEVRGPDKTPNATERFLPSDSTPLVVWQSQPADPKPEKRVHTRHLYKTIGRDLLSASSPREMLEGILHAMIGVFISK